MIDNTEFYIHLGLHKTASTFFQKKLYPSYRDFNYLHLRDKSSLSAFNQYVLRENDLFFSTKVAKKLFFRSLDKNELSKFKKITLCEEQFSGFPLHDAYNRKIIFDRLHKLFPKAKYILVLRNQKDFILSMYAEYLKKGGQESIENFLSVKKTNLNFSRGSYLQYYSYIKYIVSIVGGANIKVLYYEDMKSEPSSFFQSLLSFFNINIKIDLELIRQKENISFSIRDYEIVRFYNRFCKSTYSPNHFFNRKHLKFITPLVSYMKKDKDFQKVVDSYIKKLNFNNENLPEYSRIKKYGY